MAKTQLPKTLDEHRQFLCDFVRLKLWFIAHWLRAHPDEGFLHVIRTRVDIFRKTDINAGMSKNTLTAGDFSLPAWQAIEAELERVYNASREAPPEMFEEKAWLLLRETVLARVERDFHEGDGYDDFQCGSLRYNTKVNDRGYVGFHIGNRVSPASIFDDSGYLPSCFRSLMDRTENELGAVGLQTSTWLNDYPRWLSLFPREWQDNLTAGDGDIGWSQGHWGQFVNGRGTLNTKHAAMLRETGRLPFRVRQSRCSFDALRRHLS